MILPDSSVLLKLLDFKGVLELAFAKIFTGANIVVVTSAGIVVPNGAPAPDVTQPDFQNAIPRVELKVTVGAGKKQVFAIVNGVRFNCSYDAVLAVRAITRPDAEGKSVHAQFRSQVFYIANMLSAFSNGAASVGGLTLHQVHQPITLTGTEDVYKTQEGYEHSVQNFSFDFSVDPRAVEDCLKMPVPNPLPNP